MLQIHAKEGIRIKIASNMKQRMIQDRRVQKLLEDIRKRGNSWQEMEMVKIKRRDIGDFMSTNPYETQMVPEEADIYLYFKCLI